MIGSQSLVKTPFTVELIVKLDSNLVSIFRSPTRLRVIGNSICQDGPSSLLACSGTSHVKSTEDIAMSGICCHANVADRIRLLWMDKKC